MRARAAFPRRNPVPSHARTTGLFPLGVMTVISDFNVKSDDRDAGLAPRWLPACRRLVASFATRPLVLIVGAVITALACQWGPFRENTSPTARGILVGQSGVIVSMAFRPDGAMLSSIGGDRSIVIWNNNSPPDIEPMPPAPRSVLCAAFSPNSRILAVGSSTAPVALLDLESRRWHNLGDADGSSTGATRLAFTPDGTTCAIAEQGGRIALWDVANDRRLATLGEHPDFVGELVFAPDGQTLATSGTTAAFESGMSGSRRERFAISSPSFFRASLVFSPDGRWLLVADGLQRVIGIWDMDTLSECATLTGPTGVITTLAISPDGCTLAAAYHQGWVTF